MNDGLKLDAPYRSLIEAASRRVSEMSGGRIAFEECILLPHYGGNIIFRFTLDEAERVTLEKLDEYERALYEWVNEGVLIDFIGSVYRRAGLCLDGVDEAMKNCAELYKNEPITDSPFRLEVERTSAELLALCGLDASLPVWEIQLDDVPALILLGESTGHIRTVQLGEGTIELLSAERRGCEGLMKAAMYARRSGISLMRALFALGASR